MTAAPAGDAIKLAFAGQSRPEQDGLESQASQFWRIGMGGR